jgi:hypothetical protein
MLGVIPVALLGALAIVLLRRSRARERDSIAMFSAARRAMSTIADTPAPEPAGDEQPVKPPMELHNITLRSEYSPLFDPRARREIDEARRSFRSDPRTLAHRPTVANLPRSVAPGAPDEAVVVALLRDDRATEAS